VARLRTACVAVITVLCFGAYAGSSLAHGASEGAHQRIRRAHPAARCGKVARGHSAHKSRAHGAHRSKSHGHVRTSCLKPGSTNTKHTVGNARHKSRHRSIGVSKGHHKRTAKPGKPERSKSADYSSQGCEDALLQPTAQNLESIRTATLCLVNHERAINGEAPLRANPQLQQAAQGHTESMVQDDYFEHIGPQGETPLQRMRDAGYIYSSQLGYSVGENIAWGTLWDGTPSAIVAAWMASPGHRANILDSEYRDSGIGVSPHPPNSLAHGQSGGIYTQDFGVIVG
jgi:uncharacterized protein YkwD